MTSSSSRATAWVRFVRALQAALSATQSQLVCAMVMPSAEDHSFRHPWNFASSCAISTVFFLGDTFASRLANRLLEILQMFADGLFQTPLPVAKSGELQLRRLYTQSKIIKKGENVYTAES